VKIDFPTGVIAENIKFPKTYKMNQAGVGLFGLMGALLLWDKLRNFDISTLLIIIAPYSFFICTPLFTLLSIKSSGEKYLKASKSLNYILLAFAVGGNVLGVIYMNGLKFSHIFSLLMLCAPAVINIRCLNNLNKVEENKVNS
jgi:hypothetical protein